MTAVVISLSDYRVDPCDVDIDLVTAVDVAVRDLREVLRRWGTSEAKHQLVQCEAMLTRALCAIVDQPHSR